MGMLEKKLHDDVVKNHFAAKHVFFAEDLHRH